MESVGVVGPASAEFHFCSLALGSRGNLTSWRWFRNQAAGQLRPWLELRTIEGSQGLGWGLARDAVSGLALPTWPRGCLPWTLLVLQPQSAGPSPTRCPQSYYSVGQAGLRRIPSILAP